MIAIIEVNAFSLVIAGITLFALVMCIIILRMAIKDARDMDPVPPHIFDEGIDEHSPENLDIKDVKKRILIIKESEKL
jgi:hypothetical protein